MGRTPKDKKIPQHYHRHDAVGFKGKGIDHWTHEATNMNRQLAKKRTNGKTEYVGPHKRRKKGGSRKVVELEGYYRRPPQRHRPAYCRECLFVIVDIPSGGDIEGCLKREVLEELYTELDVGDDIFTDDLEPDETTKCFVASAPYMTDGLGMEKWYEARNQQTTTFKNAMRGILLFRLGRQIPPKRVKSDD